MRPVLASVLASLLAILLAAPLFAWPALLNGYPILFSDTGGLLEMGLLPSMGWDKPFVYGPLIVAISLRLTLWLPLAAQAILLSASLWLLQRAFARTTPLRHVAHCVLLAAVTAAPWFASTLMPDALTPVVVLLLAADLGTPPRRLRLLATCLAALAIAAHLSHLPIAAAMIAALALLRRRIPWHPLASLGAALLFLIGSNLVGHGRLAVSPYGSVFALARLVADGPARRYLDDVCPGAGYALCRWRADLTDDSDQFLWDPKSPFWADPLPLPEFAAQASRIVAGTVRAYPAAVARDAYRNAAGELIRIDLGDTLGQDYLADAVRPRIERWYPPVELRRLEASRQWSNDLAPVAAHLRPLDRAALLLATIFAAFTLLRAVIRPSPRADLAALVLVALAANAFAGGALSTPHDRYQARLAWVLLLPALLSLPAPPRRSPAPAPP